MVRPSRVATQKSRIFIAVTDKLLWSCVVEHGALRADTILTGAAGAVISRGAAFQVQLLWPL